MPCSGELRKAWTALVVIPGNSRKVATCGLRDLCTRKGSSLIGRMTEGQSMSVDVLSRRGAGSRFIVPMLMPTSARGDIFGDEKALQHHLCACVTFAGLMLTRSLS